MPPSYFQELNNTIKKKVRQEVFLSLCAKSDTVAENHRHGFTSYSYFETF